MDLLTPGALLFLILVPLLVAVYFGVLRRRQRVTVRYSSLSLIRAALPDQARWRRHFPFVLFLVALACLVIALTRPVSVVAVPTNKTTIILAMDVSMSMCSTDIAPNRLEVAQKAALDFIRQQKPGTQIGIVAFSGFAELIQAPTTDAELLQAAIDSLITGRRTAIGSSILKSLDAIAEIDPDVPPSSPGRANDPKIVPVPKGAYVPDIIVLLTDGANNYGPQPLVAAQQAAERGVRVYTIGFGTERGGEFPRCSPGMLGSEPIDPGFGGQGGRPGGGGGFGGGGFGGGPPGGFRRGIDEDTLKKVADLTGGTYSPAESANDLLTVFRDLPTNLIMKHETTELSVGFAAVAALLITASLVLSMLWRPIN
jgi:Ca-activated chloride channel family protein